MTGKPFHPAIVAEMEKAFNMLDFPQRKFDMWRPMGTAPKDGTEVKLLIRHRNHLYAADWDRKNWEQEVRAKWIDFNGGGWTWNGMCGEPQGWRPLPANVAIEGPEQAQLANGPARMEGSASCGQTENN